jgi:hypothetical protein
MKIPVEVIDVEQALLDCQDLSDYANPREFKQALRKGIIEKAHDSFPHNYVPDAVEVNKAILEQEDIMTNAADFNAFFVEWLKGRKNARVYITIDVPKEG